MSPPNALALHHCRVRLDDAGIAWLLIDSAGTSVNRLSTEVLSELSGILDQLDRERPSGLVIHSGKESGFIAGADIDEFDELHDADAVQRFLEKGWNLFNRLASVPYPTLALIHGHCLGGGLELALACRYRLAVDDPATRMGLPEVMLGIFPGWGGMKRLPALIGAPAALDMMLSGRPADVRKALRLGLIDAKVPRRLQFQAAAQQLRSGKRNTRAAGIGKLLNWRPLRPLVMRMTEKQINKRDPYQHYLAPRAIVEIWARYDGNALKAPALVNEVARSDTARNLLRVFRLQERLKANGKIHSNAAAVRHVHVIGAGVMGGDIAAWCSYKGLKVTLQDQERERIAAAQGRAATLFNRRFKDARLQRSAFDRLIPDPAGHGLTSADLVLEAITEDLPAKQALYARIEPLMKPGAILATNTSSLSLAELGMGLQRPERFVGIHFFNPVAKMPLVEVVQSPALAADALATALGFVGKLGKLPLPVKDAPGFLVNAVLAPYMLEAMRCVDEGITPETVDEAMKVFGMPMGPLELADTVGLDVAAAAGRQLSGCDELPRCLEAHLSRKELGRKTGKGFYRWNDGKPVKKEPAAAPGGLALRLITPLIEKTQERVDEGVVMDADLADAGVIFGTGFAPFTGGPLNWKNKQSGIASATKEPST